MNQLRWKKEVEHSMREEFEYLLPKKIQRLSRLDTAWLIPNHHFASASAECISLFLDGHFYGCISLLQAVSEATVRFLCKKNKYQPSSNYERNVGTLLKRGFISSHLSNYFLKIWEKRDDYHHLNDTVLKDRQALEILAEQKINLLHKIQQEIFHFNIREGMIVPRNPKYWDTADDTAYIQTEPITRWIFKKPIK